MNYIILIVYYITSIHFTPHQSLSHLLVINHMPPATSLPCPRACFIHPHYFLIIFIFVFPLWFISFPFLRSTDSVLILSFYPLSLSHTCSIVCILSSLFLLYSALFSPKYTSLPPCFCTVSAYSFLRSLPFLRQYIMLYIYTTGYSSSISLVYSNVCLIL